MSSPEDICQGGGEGLEGEEPLKQLSEASEKGVSQEIPNEADEGPDSPIAEVPVEETLKKVDSGRLPLSKRLLDPNHPGMKWLEKELPKKIELLAIDPTWRTIAEMLKDKREISIGYPFCDETVAVVIKTYLKFLYQRVLKKVRLPEEEKSYVFALRIAANMLLWDEKLKKTPVVTAAGTQVKKENVQKNANDSKNTFVIGANNIIASVRLPEELWSPHVRKKVELKKGMERKEHIPQLSELNAMLYLYQSARRKKDITDIERVHLYLLLLDPQYYDYTLSFEYHKHTFRKRYRFILKQAIRYAMGVTYYSKTAKYKDSEEKEEKYKKNLRKELMMEFADRVREALIGDVFKQKRERIVAQEVLQEIDLNLQFLLEPPAELGPEEEPEVLGPLKREGEGLRLPNPPQKVLRQNLTDIENRDDFVLLGLMNYLLREEQSEMDEIE